MHLKVHTVGLYQHCSMTLKMLWFVLTFYNTHEITDYGNMTQSNCWTLAVAQTIGY